MADKRRQRQEEAQKPVESGQGKRVQAFFYRTEAGGEPVREWLKSSLSPEDRKRIGEDIKTVEFGWPIGMPVCRAMGGGIYEVRSELTGHRIARILFYIISAAEWWFCMDLSKRHRKHSMKTWNWHERTRKNMRGHNESKEKKRSDRAHRFQF